MLSRNNIFLTEEQGLLLQKAIDDLVQSGKTENLRTALGRMQLENSVADKIIETAERLASAMPRLHAAIGLLLNHITSAVIL